MGTPWNTMGHHGTPWGTEEEFAVTDLPVHNKYITDTEKGL